MKRFARSLRISDAVILVLLIAPASLTYRYSREYYEPDPLLWSDAKVDRMTTRYVFGELPPLDDRTYSVHMIPGRAAEAAIRVLESSWYRPRLGKPLEIEVSRYSDESKLPVERAYRLLQTDEQRSRTLPLLLLHAGSPDPEVRSFVFRTVIPSGDDRVLPVIPLALADSPSVVETTLEGLIKAVASRVVSSRFQAAALTAACSQIKAGTHFALAVSLGLRIDSNRFMKFLEAQSLLDLKTGDSIRVVNEVLLEHRFVPRSHFRACAERSLNVPHGDAEIDAIRKRLFITLGGYSHPDDEALLMSLMDETNGANARVAALAFQRWHGLDFHFMTTRTHNRTPTYRYCSTVSVVDRRIGNSGLAVYFSGPRGRFSNDWDTFRNALLELQMTESLNVFQRALDLFPDSQPASDGHSRKTQLARIAPEALSDLSQQWNAFKNQRFVQLTKYAVHNKREFLRNTARVWNTVEESHKREF